MSKPAMMGWILAAALAFAKPAAAAGPRKIAVWGTTQDSVGYVAALSDALGKRPGFQVLGDLEAPEWFLGCSKETSDHCVEHAARAHKLDLVLRVWSSRSGQMLASTVDVIDAHKGPQKTFQDQGTENTPEALHALAKRALDTLFGPVPGEQVASESPQDALAKEHFKKAREAYRQADYQTAITEFEAAYAAKPSGVIRYNIAQADEKLGDIPGALLNYHRYLHETPNAEDRATVEKAIANLEKRLQERGVQQLEVFSQPSGAAVSVDGKARGNAPLSIELAPGEHEVELQLAGYQTSKRKVTLKADKSVELDVALSPGSATQTTPEVATTNPNTTTTKPEVTTTTPEVKHHQDEGPSGLRIASYATAGVGVALLAVGTIEGLQVSSKNNDISKDQAAARSGDPAAINRISSNYSSAKSASTIANIGLIGGGALVATGVVLYFLSPSDSDDKPTASVGVTPHGAAVALSGHF